MAVFKVPRITTLQRTNLLLQVGEVVHDTDQNVLYGGDDITYGGFPIGSNAGSIVQVIPLTQTDIDNKYVTVTIAPLNFSTVTVTPHGGPMQIYGIDFIGMGNQLKWEGLGLDNFLDITDVLIIQY